MRSLRYRTLVPAVVLLSGLLLLYPEISFQRKIFLAGDVEAAMSFARAAHRVMIKENVYPLWNPYLFSGMPSYESLAYNPYVYPLSFFTGFLITNLHFPPNSWLLFHALLLGAGVFLLLRSRGVMLFPALMAAVFMMWMPNLVAIGANGHGSQACAIAYIPFALLFWDRLARGKGVLLNGSALVLVLGFQMLRGHVQISYYTYSLVVLHFLFYAVAGVMDGARRKRPEHSALPPSFAPFLLSRSGVRGRIALEAGTLFVILAIVVALSLLLSAVLYLPVHEYAAHSVRGATAQGGLEYDYATSWSLHPLESLTFFLPFSFGFGKNLYYGRMPFTDYPNYLGLVVLLGAVAAVALRRTRFVVFLLFVSILSTLVSFGKFFPVLYLPLFKWLPYFNKFRVPVMVLIIQQISVVMLFAFGLQAIIERKWKGMAKVSLRALVASVVILVLALLTQSYWRGDFAQAVVGKLHGSGQMAGKLALAKEAGRFLSLDLIRFALMLGAVFGALYLFSKRLLDGRVFLAVVFLIGLLDFFLVDRFIIHPEKLVGSDAARIVRSERVVDEYLEPDPVVRFLESQQGYFRIFPFFHPRAPFYGEFSSNRFMLFGISSIGGYHAAKLASYNRFLNILGRELIGGRYRLLDMMNVRYVVAAYPLPEEAPFEAVWSGPNEKGEQRIVYENHNVMPRVYFVDRYIIVPYEKAIDMLGSDDFDPARLVLLQERPDLEPVSAGDSEAEITKFSFNEIRVSAVLSEPAIMVLSEIYYPRWKVFVDGEEAALLRANALLRAVALPAGRHEVVFEYDASHIKSAFRISLAAFALDFLLLSGAVAVQGRRRWKHL